MAVQPRQIIAAVAALLGRPPVASESPLVHQSKANFVANTMLQNSKGYDQGHRRIGLQ